MRLLHSSDKTGVSVLLRLVGWRSARLQHLLHQVEANSGFAFILRNREVVEKVEVAHVGAVGVAVLVYQPLPLGGIGVARADVLGLQVLQLAVDGVAVSHLVAFPLFPGQRPQRRSSCSRFSRGREATAQNLQAAQSQANGVTVTNLRGLAVLGLRGGSGSVFCHGIGVA